MASLILAMNARFLMYALKARDVPDEWLLFIIGPVPYGLLCVGGWALLKGRLGPIPAVIFFALMLTVAAINYLLFFLQHVPGFAA